MVFAPLMMRAPPPTDAALTDKCLLQAVQIVKTMIVASAEIFDVSPVKWKFCLCVPSVILCARARYRSHSPWWYTNCIMECVRVRGCVCLWEFVPAYVHASVRLIKYPFFDSEWHVYIKIVCFPLTAHSILSRFLRACVVCVVCDVYVLVYMYVQAWVKRVYMRVLNIFYKLMLLFSTPRSPQPAQWIPLPVLIISIGCWHAHKLAIPCRSDVTVCKCICTHTHTTHAHIFEIARNRFSELLCRF